MHSARASTAGYATNASTRTTSFLWHTSMKFSASGASATTANDPTKHLDGRRPRSLPTRSRLLRKLSAYFRRHEWVPVTRGLSASRAAATISGVCRRPIEWRRAGLCNVTCMGMTSYQSRETSISRCLHRSERSSRPDRVASERLARSHRRKDGSRYYSVERCRLARTLLRRLEERGPFNAALAA
jgi:hypothetical protein